MSMDTSLLELWFQLLTRSNAIVCDSSLRSTGITTARIEGGLHVAVPSNEGLGPTVLIKCLQGLATIAILRVPGVRGWGGADPLSTSDAAWRSTRLLSTS